ncbi:MAG: hypothetical protein FWE02_03685 [Defluviitaleaceae bacterium]|nr:hypothetical protein [Defluviitaleaceae bacterium]
MEKEYYTPGDLVKLGIYKDINTVYSQISKGNLKAKRLKSGVIRIKKIHLENEFMEDIEVSKECPSTKEEKSITTGSLLKDSDLETHVERATKNLRKSLKLN